MRAHCAWRCPQRLPPPQHTHATPRHAGGLLHLECLRLHRNRLRQLPPALSRTRLIATADLTIRGNPLVHPVALHTAFAHARTPLARLAGGHDEAAAAAPAALVEGGGAGGCGRADEEPSRAWVRWLMDELWELDQAMAQDLALAVVAFGPGPADLRSAVLDSLLADGRRRGGWPRWLGGGKEAVPEQAVGERAGAAREGAAVVIEEVLRAHSTRVVDVGGQQVQLCFSVAGSVGCQRAGERGGGGGARCHDGPLQRGKGGGDAGAIWRVLQEEMVPGRVLPVFVWKSSDSADDVLASAEALIQCLATSGRRYAAATAGARAGDVGEVGVGGGDGDPAGWPRGGAARKSACEGWSRALGIVLVCVADGAASGEGSGSSARGGHGGGGHAGCVPGVVLQYFRQLRRRDAAARREGSDCEVGGDADGLDNVGADSASSGVYVGACDLARII